MLLTALLLASFESISQSNSARKDSVCFDIETGRSIASKLVDGYNCSENIKSVEKSYSDCREENIILTNDKEKSDELHLLKDHKIIEQAVQIDDLQHKVVNKNKWIGGLGIALLAAIGIQLL